MAFCFIRKVPPSSACYRGITSWKQGSVRMQRVISIQNFCSSLPQNRLCTKFLPSSSVIISQRFFSLSNPRSLWPKNKKLDANDLDPESGQPYTHPVKGHLVYSGPLTKAVKRLKRLSLFTSGMGFLLIPSLITKQFAWPAICGFGFFVFMTPFLIHFIFAKNYVTEIYFNEDNKKFSLGKISFFVRRQEMEFVADDVIIPDIPGTYSNYKIKGKSVFINRTLFTSKEVYKHMVGYDKPFDFNLPEPVDVTNTADNTEIEELNRKIKSKAGL